jgi:diketogulonate reductase-like aldo/keto reductase
VQFFDEARIKPAVNQISVYPCSYDRSLEAIEYCQRENIRIEPYEVSSSLIRLIEKGKPVARSFVSCAELTPSTSLLQVERSILP